MLADTVHGFAPGKDLSAVPHVAIAHGLPARARFAPRNLGTELAADSAVHLLPRQGAVEFLDALHIAVAVLSPLFFGALPFVEVFQHRHRFIPVLIVPRHHILRNGCVGLLQQRVLAHFHTEVCPGRRVGKTHPGIMAGGHHACYSVSWSCGRVISCVTIAIRQTGGDHPPGEWVIPRCGRRVRSRRQHARTVHPGGCRCAQRGLWPVRESWPGRRASAARWRHCGL